MVRLWLGAMFLCYMVCAGGHAAAAAPSAADGHATASPAGDAAAVSKGEDPAAAAGQGAVGEEAAVIEGSAADRGSSKASLQRYRKVGRSSDTRQAPGVQAWGPPP